MWKESKALTSIRLIPGKKLCNNQNTYGSHI